MKGWEGGLVSKYEKEDHMWVLVAREGGRGVRGGDRDTLRERERDRDRLETETERLRQRQIGTQTLSSYNS